MGNNDAVTTATWLAAEMRDAGQADRSGRVWFPRFPETSEPGLILQTVFVAANRKYPVELRERAVRLYRESIPSR